MAFGMVLRPCEKSRPCQHLLLPRNSGKHAVAWRCCHVLVNKVMVRWTRQLAAVQTVWVCAMASHCFHPTVARHSRPTF